MQLHLLADAAVTPALTKWLAAQNAAGCSRSAMFEALKTAGWPAGQAAHIMSLTADEQLSFGVAQPLKSPALPTSPQPRLVFNDVQVDGGDKWVRVLQHRSAPELIEFEGLLSTDECQALMDAARPRLSRSLTVDVHTGGEQIHADRSSQGMFFDRLETPLIAAVEARIAKLLQWPLENGEGLQVLRYPPGAQYVPHYDYFDPRQSGTPSILKRGGQRVATMIMYLHEPAGGGATVFPDINLAIAPKRGNAVFFSYPSPDPASLTLHGGEPVTAGEKWIATKWLRQSVFQ